MNNQQQKQPPQKRRRSGSGKRQRGCIIKFRAKPDERAEIRASAKAAGLTVGSFLRSLALAAPRTRAVHIAVPERERTERFLGQVGRYTGNLRQLVKRANFGQTPDARDLAEVTQQAREFLDAARAVWEGV